MCWTKTFKPSGPTSVAMLVPASSPTYKPPSISRPPKEVRRQKTPYRLGEGEEGLTIEDALGNNKGKINAWSPPPDAEKKKKKKTKKSKGGEDDLAVVR